MVRISPISHLIVSILLFTLCTSTFGKTIYVDDDAAGANDGTSWENAYVYLQDALADANSTEKPVEIRVAQGIYMPDQGANQTHGDREATFQLINGVTLKGGYTGLVNADTNTGNFAVYETVLSGDLNSDDEEIDDPEDLWDEPTRAENSYHVLFGNSTDETAVLDGFVITGGNADGDWLIDPSGRGGGMYNKQSSPMLTNCTFSSNSAYYGGGMYNENSNPRLDNCSLDNNSAETYYEPGPGAAGAWGGSGGAMCNENSRPVLEHCTFTKNTQMAMHNTDSSPALSYCIFIGNSSWNGGAIYSWNSKPVLVNCIFNNNRSFAKGGAFAVKGHSNATLLNCIFVGNMAGNNGGAVHSYGSSATVTNCTFAANEAHNGKALECSSVSGDGPSMLQFTNCIIRNGDDEIWNDDNSTIEINFSNINGGFPGTGNINVDPLFANPGYWAHVNDPNIVIEPNDLEAVWKGVWIDGDYHLKSEAGRWDPDTESWVVDDMTSPCIDAGDPNSPIGDEPEPNGGRINMGAYGGTAQASKSPAGAEQLVYIQWLGHASVKVWTDDCIVYVDPQRLNITPHDATLVCVTHAHSDHYSPSDIARVSNAQTQFIAPPDVVSQYGSGQTIATGQTIEFDFVTIKAVPAYNINKTNHPKSNNWVGYIVELGGKRIYVAGDTDLIEEMKSLGDINVAFLPAGGTYTMDATEADEATGYIKPDLAIPYHWGQIIGTLADAQRFAELAQCPAMVMAVGETIGSDKWPVYSPLIAHWTLDETEGDIAHNSVSENHIVLFGEPAWLPDGGKIDGALQFDGVNDYGTTDFVLDPADGPFSVFTWIKGDTPGQVIIAQFGGTGYGELWLCADEFYGKLMTCLVPTAIGRFAPQFLVSEFVITDDQWHHAGFVWDGSYRALYADGIEVAKDADVQGRLKSADGCLHIGVSEVFYPSTFFSGLIDDIRIYNVALTTDEIEALVQ
jgi:L-ascorbate metabolism protein UlaG (beta-lactamase superfamily)